MWHDKMKDFMIIKDPEIAKLFADESRREILHNLRHREMTACQLARMLEKNVSSISYHLNALEEAGLVVQSRSHVKGNLIEKFYHATANKFIISYTLSEGLVPGRRYSQYGPGIAGAQGTDDDIMDSRRVFDHDQVVCLELWVAHFGNSLGAVGQQPLFEGGVGPGPDDDTCAILRTDFLAEDLDPAIDRGTVKQTLLDK